MLNEYSERIEKMIEQLNDRLEKLNNDYMENRKIIDNTKSKDPYVESYNYMTDELLKEQRILDEKNELKDSLDKLNQIKTKLEEGISKISRIDKQIENLQNEMSEETDDEVIDGYKNLIELLKDKKKRAQTEMEKILPTDSKENNNLEQELKDVEERIQNSINRFLQIFDEERKVRTSGVHSKEELDAIDKKYMDLKIAEDKILSSLRERKEELIKQLGKKEEVVTVPEIVENEDTTNISDKIEEQVEENNNESVSEEISEDNNPETEEEKVVEETNERTAEVIMEELKDGISFDERDNEKYTGKVKVFKKFREELKANKQKYQIRSRRVLANGLSFIKTLFDKVRAKISTKEDKEKYKELEKRVWELDDNDVKTIINKCENDKDFAESQPEVLKTILYERFDKIKEDKLNKEIITIHDKIYDDYNKIRSIDIILHNDSISDEEKLGLIRLRNKLLNGKAKEIHTLIDKQYTDNNINNESNIVGIQNAQLESGIEYELEEINDQMTSAVAGEDDENAIKYFVASEEAYALNIEKKLKKMDYRERRYYEPIFDGIYNPEKVNKNTEVLKAIKENNTEVVTEEVVQRSK